MTEIELNEQIEALLNEVPNQTRTMRSRRAQIRELKVRKDDRLLLIIQRHYIPHAGYVDWDFDGATLLHSGTYIKYPKNSNCQRWIKRLTAKRARKAPGLRGKGNHYRRLVDYWWTLY